VSALTEDVKQRLERELDEAVLRWKAAPQGTEGKDLQALKDEIFKKAFERFDADKADRLALDDDRYRRSFAFVEALGEAMEKYVPERGQFSHYLSMLISKRAIDRFRREREKSPDAESLDCPIGGEDGLTLEDTQPAPAGSGPEDNLLFHTAFAELTAMVLNFSQRHRGKEKNETRRMWYQLFYTEDMTLALKTSVLRFIHERDIFQAMDCCYLDYYMEKPCRTMAELASATLKPYGVTVPGRAPDQETPLPIPGDVSLNYLLREKNLSVKAPARSNQLKFYKEEKQALYRAIPN